MLNAGDWDRDGYGDVITRQTSDRQPGAVARRRARPLRRAGVARPRASAAVGRLAAVGDMTGDGYPDLMGQPRGRRPCDLPGPRAAGPRRRLPGVRRDQRRQPDRRRPLGRRRRPGQPVPRGRQPDPLPGQRPRRAHRPRGSPVDLSPLRLGDRRQRPAAGPATPTCSCGRRAPATSSPPGHDRRASAPAGLPRRGARGLRPGGLTRPVEARRDALGGRDRSRRSRVGVGDQDQRAAARQRLGEGGEPGGEAGFASERRRPPSVSMTPGGGRSPQLRLGDPGHAPRSSSAGAGPRRRTRPAATTPRRRRRGRRPAAPSANRTPSGSSALASTGTPSASPAQRVHPVGAGHDGVGLARPSTTSSPTVQAAPRTTGAEPVRRAGRRAAGCRARRSSSSASSEATFATQLAYVVTDSSIRSPVASS